MQGPSGQSREIEAVVDTGYNRYLTLPPGLASALELPFVTTNPAFLADGSEVTFDVHSVTVLWDGHSRDVDVHVSDAAPLVGMRLLDRHSLSWRWRTEAASSSRPDSSRTLPPSTTSVAPLPAQVCAPAAGTTH